MLKQSLVLYQTLRRQQRRIIHLGDDLAKIKPSLAGDMPKAGLVNLREDSSSSSKRGKYINWKNDILPELKSQFREFREQGITATIRGLLYILESKDILKKTDYNGLSKHLVEWREDGTLPLNCVVDKTRRIIDINQYVWIGQRLAVQFDEKLQTWDNLISPEDHIQCGIAYLNKTIEDIYNHIPRWLGQSKYLEAFIEKNAISSSFNSILNTGDNPRQIIVNPNGGWSSYTFVMNNIGRILKQKEKGKDCYVQYYGDSDPTGERMTASDSKLVKTLDKFGINFERIAIDEQTIKDFKLEKIRDKSLDYDTLKKLKNDPNYSWFTERHNGQLWQIELDALQFNLQKFKELVLSNADKHFDTSIQKEAREEFLKRYPKADINQRIIDELEKLRNTRMSIGMDDYYY